MAALEEPKGVLCVCVCVRYASVKVTPYQCLSPCNHLTCLSSFPDLYPELASLDSQLTRLEIALNVSPSVTIICYSISTLLVDDPYPPCDLTYRVADYSSSHR